VRDPLNPFSNRASPEQNRVRSLETERDKRLWDSLSL
jgi:hypothetical protein